MPTYTKLEYIESTGTQYINILIKPSTADTKIECEAMYMGSNSYANLFGIRTGGSSSRDFYQFNKTGTANQYRWICGRGGDAYFTNTNLTEKTRLLFEGNKCYINDALIVTSGSSNSGANLFLFARNNEGVGVDQYGNWRLYSFKIYKNNELVRDFIPVKTTDGDICLYDLISKTFYMNRGSGSFIAGPEILGIKLLKINGIVQPKINGKKVYLFNGEQTHYNYDFNSFYTPIDYIEGTGTQWVDTGIQPITTTKIATKCSFSVDGGSVFIGATGLPDNNDFRIFRASGQYLYFDRGGGRLNNSLALNTVYELEFGNWYMKINGQTVQSGSAFNISLSSNTIKVMPTTNADYGKIYYLKIYNGDTLVRDFIPVIRNIDNKIGLYDKTTKQFFTNQGTGEFLGG